MKLLPYDTFTLQTLDPLPLVIERLATKIEPEKLVRWQFSHHHLPYEGTYSEAGFQIRRLLHYRNSFQPIIRGRFESLASGTRVRITMRLHSFVIAFLVFWYLIWYSFFFPVWLTGAMSTAFAWLFLGLPIAVLFAFWGAFWAEVSRSRYDLVQMILGHVDPSSMSRHSYPWLPKAMQWGVFLLGLIIAIAFLQINGSFRPSPSVESESLNTVSCSQHPNHSTVCNFSLVRTITGHPAASALAISADGQTLVSGGNDKAIRIWDLKTGQLKKTLQSDSGKIKAVAIAPDGKTVVSGSTDRRVRLWDLTTNRRPQLLVGHPDEINRPHVRNRDTDVRSKLNSYL